MNSTAMNGDHSITSREVRRRTSVTEKEMMPSANQKKTRSCDVGTPTLTIIVIDAATHSVGAPIRAALRKLTGEH